MDTITQPGFARVDDDGIFHYAPYGVYAPDYTLLLADKDTYTYPTEGGWNWYETEAEARIALNAPAPVESPPAAQDLMSISGNFPSQPPTLLLDFANSSELDPRITFTRASPATYYDGQTSVVAEQNLLAPSQGFTSANGWINVSSGVAVAVNNANTAPDGSNTATQLTFGGSNTYWGKPPTVLVTAGLTYTFSIYAQVADGLGNLTFNLGFVPTGGGTTQLISVTATSTYSQLSVTFPNIQPGPNYSLTSYQAYVCIVSSSTRVLNVWGAQLEQRANATAYIVTTSSAITNYTPQLMTAANNVPRFDHNPTTGQSLGLLVEESRTNLNTNSTDFNSWSATNANATNNTQIAPDGTLTAATLNPTANVNNLIAKNQSAFSAGSYTFSVYAKTNGARWLVMRLYDVVSTWYVYFDLISGVIGNNGAQLATITSVGNGWYRCSMSQTVSANAGNILISASDLNLQQMVTSTNNKLFLWGAQLEAGAFATSYIPTTSSTVTRNADNASMTGTNFSSWYNTNQGTLYAEHISNYTKTGNQYIAEIYSDGSNRAVIIDGYFAMAGVNGTPVVVTPSSLGSTIKQAISWYSNTGISTNYQNGTSYALSSSGYQKPFNTLVIGQYTSAGGNQSQLNGYIRKIAYWPQALSNTQLQALTKS